MKKCLIALLLLFTSVQLAFADDTANIRIRITGAVDNRYFLCEPNIGCLSIYNAVRKNKTYPIYHSIDMDKLYVTDTADMGLSPQGLPKSCDVTVNTNKTITIYGNLVPSKTGMRVNNLRCTLS